MFISIFPPRRGEVPPFDTPFSLQQDNWNDFHFKTQYHLYRRQKSDESRPTLIGPLKILRKGQTGTDGILIKEPFDLLNEQYCSVGVTLDYYQRLNELPTAERNDILLRLRDVVASPNLRSEFETESGWAISLFRDNPDPGVFLADAQAILTGNFSALADMDSDWSFQPARWTQPLTLNFGATTNWFHLNYFPSAGLDHVPIPRRIIAVIGRNGSGKSTLLSRIARVAFADPSERQTAEIQAIGSLDPPSIGFTKIIAISYSAFDNFVVPGVYESELRQIASDIERGGGRYVYVGLRDIVAEVRDDLSEFEKQQLPDNERAKLTSSDRRPGTRLKSLAQLAEEFERLIALINERGDDKIFREALEPIFSDASFADIDGDGQDALLGTNPRTAFLEWSTGHKIVLHVVAAIVAHAVRRSIILFDEPEMHLHPPFTAALMHSLRIVLERKEALAIVATHSPVVLQETLARHVRIVHRNGENFDIRPASAETYGENIGSLIYDAFGLTAASTDYHKVLNGLIARHSTLEEIDAFFTPGLSGQARAYVMTGLAKKARAS